MKKVLLVISFVILLTSFSSQTVYALESTGTPCDTANPTACTGGQVCTRQAGDDQPYCYETAASGAGAPLNATKLFAGGPPNKPGGWIGAIFYGTANHIGGQNGATGQVASMMQAFYVNPPSSTYYAFADFGKSFNFPAKPAYAQSYGFEALNPILPLWKAFRNLALVGFVIIFVIIGIMIMLRRNIDQRTVVNIQIALPKIVIALVLVILSYALAGLLVDSITLITRAGLVALQTTGVLAQGGNGASKGQNIENLMNANIFELFYDMYDTSALSARIFETLTFRSPDGTPSADLGSVFNFFAKFFTFQLGEVSALQLVLYIAVFIAFIRTFFMLLTNYLYVVLNIIFSPFYFLMSAIPGNSASFENWLRSMYKHLLVFPLVLFMLAFAAIFNGFAGGSVWQGGNSIWNIGPANGGNCNGVFAVQNTFWGPPALGYWGGAVGPLLSLGILLTVPRAAGMIQAAFERKGATNAAQGAAQESIQNAFQRIPGLRNFTK